MVKKLSIFIRHPGPYTNLNTTCVPILVLNDMATLLTIVTMAEPETRNNLSHESKDSTNPVTCFDTRNGTYHCAGSLRGQYKQNVLLRRLTTRSV